QFALRARAPADPGESRHRRVARGLAGLDRAARRVARIRRCDGGGPMGPSPDASLDDPRLHVAHWRAGGRTRRHDLRRVPILGERLLARRCAPRDRGAGRGAGPVHRGWGIGAFFAIQATGVGLAAGLLPLVDVAREGWRILYAVGLLPLLAIAWWWRRLPETRRFEAYRREMGAAGGLLSPTVALARAYPVRFFAIVTVVFLFAFGGAAADFMGPKYLQQAHGWSPSRVTLLYLTGGAFGILGSVVGGRGSDGRGRKPATVVFGLASAVGAIVFYNASAWRLPMAWVATIFALLGHDTLLGTFGAELFPTSHRATAGGARLVAATLGGALGLAAESVLYERLGSHWTAISVL